MNVHTLSKSEIKEFPLTKANGVLENILTELNSTTNDEIKSNLLEKQELVEARITKLGGKGDELDKYKTKLLSVVNENSYAYLTHNGKYISVINSGVKDRPNIEIEEYTVEQIIDTIALEANVEFKYVDNKAFKKWMRKQNKHYKKKIMSVFEKDYSNLYYNIFTHLKQHFIQPDYNATEYDPGFDALMYSLGGGKEENIEYLKKWLGYSYLYPDRCTSTPSIEISGLPGGNGKGVLEGILKIMYGDSSVVGFTRHEMDKFNALLSYGLFGIIDEAHPEQISTNDLKALVGNKSRRHEAKGIDACIVDNNLVYLFFNNHYEGMIKLDGGGMAGSDRRWGIIITNITLVDAFEKFFGEAINGADDINIDAFVDQYINSQLYNRIEIAKFLGCIIKQYKLNELYSLPPLHGDDYTRRYSIQKDNTTEAFDFITKVALKHGMIPTKILLPLVKGYTENPNFKLSSLKKRYEAYLDLNGIRYKYRKSSTTLVNNGVNIFSKVRLDAYVFNESRSKEIIWDDYTSQTYKDDKDDKDYVFLKDNFKDNTSDDDDANGNDVLTEKLDNLKHLTSKTSF